MADDADRNSALDELLDRQAIWDCLVRYGRGVDRLDEELVRSAFWPNAQEASKGSVDAFLDAWRAAQPDREVSHHIMTNHHAVFRSTSLVNAETSLLAVVKAKSNASLELLGGRYLDRFEKRDGEWRIVYRRALLDWQCLADASAMEAKLSRTLRGTRDRTDPSYDDPPVGGHTG